MGPWWLVVSGLESRLRALQVMFNSLLEHRPFLCATGACERARTALLLAAAARARLRDPSSDGGLRAALSALARAESAVEELVRLVEPPSGQAFTPPREAPSSSAHAARRAG